MNRLEYQNHPEVRRFQQWVEPFLNGRRPFQHRWQSPKWGPWSCNGVFHAYECFQWPYTVEFPGAAKSEKGRTFKDNAATLDRLGKVLRASRDRGDAAEFLDATIAVVKWGGVPRNIPRLNGLGSAALRTIIAAASQLDPMQADTRSLESVYDMNSGFSKIYSLLLDGFPIYDSRVAAALTFFIREYCRETCVTSVPPTLGLRLPPSRRKANRDPSWGTLGFQRLWPGRPRDYAISNLMAAWLLEPMSKMGKFSELPTERRLLAVESALFMIGYEVPAGLYE